ncbi:MAG: TAXI family TRAP transporter solute-binding subunit [Pyramidobacter sp.]|jgi:TRAP transporter TAXI family solute receptor|nr:TAXI family TRAP transporter solute-binding subunit [Pyramidobacter sp.]MBP3848170.1 TAXI family TRAP transporter solute-binding subunit [Pyramidobacter sp.]MBR1895529.1 TAXI family TRAP transporter solute-binding subunit [Pyramidobacter sp.]
MIRKTMKSVFAAAVVFALASSAFAADFARIGTSSVGGGFYLIGNTIAQVGNAAKNGVNYTAVTGGSTKNLNALAKGDIEFGMCQSATINEGVTGTGAFKKPLTSLRFVAAIYQMPCHVLVKGDDMKTIEDFRGKPIDFGAIGQGIETYCRIILNTYGIYDKDIKINRYGKTESAEAIKTGEVKGNFWTTTAPNAQVSDMITGGVRLLSIDEDKRQQIVKEHPYFALSVIPGGTYEGHPNDLKTIAAIGVLCSDEKVSDEVVYKTVKAMFENVNALKERLPNYFKDFGPEHALDGCSMPIHPGAEKYYKEIGLIK